MKPLSIYLDTNAFRYFGIAFENVSLAPEITEKILVSPLSLFEVFAQLGDDNPAKCRFGLASDSCDS
jgi:hypothetical protein